jgi:hypothetical protein
MNFTYVCFADDVIYESVTCPDCDWKYGPKLISDDVVDAAQEHCQNTGHSPEEMVSVRITSGPKDPDDDDSETDEVIPMLTSQWERLWRMWREDCSDDNAPEEEP